MSGLSKSLSKFTRRMADEAQEARGLDALIKRTQLQESGYDVTPRPRFGGLFGQGYDIRPNTNVGQLPEGFVRVGGKAVQDPTYYNPGREREKARIKSEEDVRAAGLFNQLTSDGNAPPGTTARFGRYTIPVNPKLTGEETAAVAAENVFVPTAEQIKSKTKGGVFKSKFGDIGRTYRQAAAGQENALFTSYDPQLQALQGNINSIRRYVFGEGGKQLTPFEAKVVMALINPTGKSDAQYLTDIGEATRIIEEKSRLALGGANVAKQRFGQPSQTNDLSQLSDEELRQMAGL